MKDRATQEEDAVDQIIELHDALAARREAERQSRIAAGAPRFTDLQGDARREYFRRMKAESRYRASRAAQRNGATAFNAAAIRDALADAALKLIADGDRRADAVLDLAASSFAAPGAARDTIRRRAPRMKLRVLRLSQSEV